MSKLPGVMRVSRRVVLKGGAAATVVAGLEVSGAAPASAAANVFAHGVASGDPTATAVVLWTRVTPLTTATPGSGVGPPVTVVWELAADPECAHILRSGTVKTTAARDHTVKVDVRELDPYTRYWYRFRALDQVSRVGRTQTAPDEGHTVHALRFGFVSCSCLTGGYFSAYRHLADRDDLDMVVHLGDYLYEYGNGDHQQDPAVDPDGDTRYGPASLAGRRDHVPDRETVSGADYRMRYGQYRRDPDCQRLHARLPWILVFDDHEVANDAYDGGAEDHQPQYEGDFYVRRAAAYAAYVDWQPIRLADGSLRTPASLQTNPREPVRFRRRFGYGPLADLSALETRQNRSQQAASLYGGLFGYGPELTDPNRHLPDPAELAWLESGVEARGHTWHLLANQVLFARVQVATAIPDLLGAAGLTSLQQLIEQQLQVPTQVVVDPDAWDGYQADQRALMQAIAASRHGDTVVLTGDIHSSWANELPLDATTYAPPLVQNSVGVEMVCPSITSDSLGEAVAGRLPTEVDPTLVAALLAGAVQADNRHVRYLDGERHGFCVLDVTPARVRADWWYISDRTDPRATLKHGAAWETLAGSRTLQEAHGGLPRRSDRPRIVGAGRVPPMMSTP